MFDDKNSKLVPGPGNYHTTVPRDTPLYSMGARIKDLEDKTKAPGAGAYDPALG
jgi:hypothetical protein